MRIRADIVPNEYIQVAYLENTSSSYIDTGVVSLNKKFCIDLQFTSNATRQLMGISGSGSEYFGNNKGAWEKIGNSNSVPVSSRCIINYDVGNITSERTNTWIEGSTNKYVGATASGKWSQYSQATFKPFSLNGDVANYGCKMKLFGLKVYNASNSLVNNFIPCIRKIDKALGLYDIVGKTFVASINSGMINGTNVSSYKISLYPRLPSAYQEVEYIQSSGTQYINTGYIPTINNTRCVTKFMPLNTSDTAFFGARNGDNPFYFFYNIGGNYTWPISQATKVSGSSALAINTIYNIDWNRGDYKFYDSNMNLLEYATRSGSSPCNTSMYIFNFQPTDSRSTVARVYYFKIYDNDVLVRDFIPCYRKSDNVIGLFDIVNQQFYTNSGTGTFTKGNNVNNILCCKPPYVIVEGTTNIKPWSSTITTTTITGWDATKNDGSTAYTRSGYGYGYNSGVPSPSVGYHAHWVYKDGELVMKFPNLNSEVSQKGRWLGISGGITIPWHAGDKYTISWEQMTDNVNLAPFGGIYYKLNSSGSKSFHDGNTSLGYSSQTGVWERKSKTFTVNSNYDGTVTSADIYIYGYSSSQEGTIYVKNVQIEYKDHMTAFTPNTRPDNTII